LAHWRDTETILEGNCAQGEGFKEMWHFDWIQAEGVWSREWAAGLAITPLLRRVEKRGRPDGT